MLMPCNFRKQDCKKKITGSYFKIYPFKSYISSFKISTSTHERNLKLQLRFIIPKVQLYILQKEESLTYNEKVVHYTSR